MAAFQVAHAGFLTPISAGPIGTTQEALMLGSEIADISV